MLALDVGTSSVRAQHFEPSGEPHGKLHQEAYESADPDDVFAAVHRVLHGHVPDAVSCFAHSLVAVDREWNALTPILGWRDTRSAGAAERLGKQLDAERVHARTGAFLHPSYWPAKLAWLAEEEPEIFRRAEWFVAFADYIRGVPETSVSMASSSGLLDLATHDWDEELLAALGVERDRLPQIADVPVWVDAACSNV
ncbi:MAG TPA: FGGY family carbohydrate kinase, partial [Gaiellaceae bacterium]|nr:FGGY family carbohydrate kinase [Gaiellaceae bacterium]